MANWTTFDFPPLPHNPNPTRAPTHPTRPVTHSQPSILGKPAAHRGGGEPPRRGGFRGRGGGFNRGSVTDHNPHNADDLSEKFDELEVIEESFKLSEKTNDNANQGFKVKYSDACDEIPVEASGENVPKPVNKFEEISELGLALHENIKRCNYVNPTPIQRHAIPILMAGRDLMACAQTGSGKTAAFCFPIIARILNRRPTGDAGFRGRGRPASPLALIMSPTRELSSQVLIHDEAKKFANQTGVKVVVAYGGTPMSEQLYKLERGVDILVATPGRLVDMIERGRVSLRMVRYFALDEADRMLDMGFEPQIRKIAEELDMPPTGSRQTMLFSATFPAEIQRLASDFLSNYIFLTVGKVGSSNDMIEQRVELVDDYDKSNYLRDLLIAQKRDGTTGKAPLTIVFAETKRAVDHLAKWLSEKGFPATAIHGDKVQMERERALRSFKSGATPIMVATDVAARGLDIPCVAHVINYDLPRDIEHYVHRIGRTGRAGKSGIATALFCEKDRPISKALAEIMKEANQAVPSWLTEYARSASSYGYGGGRRNNRGGNFGGHDYRSFDNANFSNSYSDNYSSTYSDNYSSNYTEDYSTNEVPKPEYTEDYTTTYVDEGTKSKPYGVGYGANHGYESIVATGWD
ncbi:hypothetical protein KSS87_020874 [Heliosperma pusillum]|nr:hypothetical protein KSS87_020874 [Heliosperma pusillum]